MSSEYNNLLQKFENNVPIILDSGVSTGLECREAPMRKGHGQHVWQLTPLKPL